jgi:hypothetical protein
MVGNADHMKIVPAPDPGHVILGGEKMIVQRCQDPGRLQFNRKGALAGFPSYYNTEIHGLFLRFMILFKQALHDKGACIRIG